MSNDDNFINNFYDFPKELSDDNYNKVTELLNKYKREIIDNKYILFVTDKDIIYKLFILFLYYFDAVITNELKSDKTKKFHVGIDFEFNMREVALMQLNFGIYEWVVNPNYYDSEKKEIINDKLFWNSKVYKVFHGADSLDLPYLFSKVFDDKKENIMKFMRKYVDTRFLCEYVRNSKKEEGKCSIYDGMMYMGTIDKKKYDELIENSEAMGPIQDVMWDIKKLSSLHIKYAFYDVLHLLDFMVDTYTKINKETPDYTRDYYYIIELIRFAILERKNITDVLEYTKQIINPMNNYFVQTKTSNKTLIDIYNDFTKDLIISDDKDKIHLTFIESVNYIKGILSFLLKYVLYGMIREKHKVHINKKDIMKNKINLNELYMRLDNINMRKINKLLKLFENEINKKLIL
ncbi:hypothetical protein Indivirus_1_157 [Indivirus ILV1]|uniref:Uncharacterized protein n=1 Tax=Indivirus ILV1 TaxID=1977633 RepID=A0A1V0SD23_9VIRU|nr:hypothetical protein Indivirus_1_157 [Indivirus ILV1]